MECLKILNQEIVALLDKNNLLHILIVKELESEIVDNTKLDEIVIENAKKLFMNSQNLSSDKEFQDWLNKHKSSEEELFYKLLRPFKIDKYCNENFSHRVNAHFLSRKSDLDKIIYSLIRVKDYYIAKELYFRLQSNEDSFGNLSRQYSEGAEKDLLGIVGPTTVNTSHPILSNLLKTLKIGEISAPSKVNDFWVIVRVESFKEAILDKTMESNMALELYNLWLEEEARSIEKNLKQKFLKENQISLTV